MNFQYLAPVPRGKDLLDLAFRKARERGTTKKLNGSWLEIIQKKEALKLDIIKDVLVQKLDSLVNAFPSPDTLPEFYKTLFSLTQNVPLYKKSRTSLTWAAEKIREIHRLGVKKTARASDKPTINAAGREVYGRISSILKQITPPLHALEESREIMRTYPDIKEMFTVCIYGFPNVGKTTLLNELTGSRAKVASYAFTTVSINSGFMKVDNQDIQVLDVPGSLARKDKMNLIEKQAELVMNDLAKVEIFVFDLSETSGYSTELQEQLYQKIRKQKEVLVYVSKKDLTPEEVLTNFPQETYTSEELKEEIVKKLPIPKDDTKIADSADSADGDTEELI